VSRQKISSHLVHPKISFSTNYSQLEASKQKLCRFSLLLTPNEIFHLKSTCSASQVSMNIAKCSKSHSRRDAFIEGTCTVSQVAINMDRLSVSRLITHIRVDSKFLFTKPNFNYGATRAVISKSISDTQAASNKRHPSIPNPT
jgi:hypothetical protein